MFARADRRTMSLVLVIAVAVVAIAIPTCQMVGCGMGMHDGMMAVWTHPGPSLGNLCTGMWVSSPGSLGVPPSELMTLLLSLFAAIAAVVLFSPRVAVQPVRLVDANAPPPPLEPRGERFTV